MVPNTLRFESDAFATGPHERTGGDDSDTPFWGADTAAWLAATLTTGGWVCRHNAEDWGWRIDATRGAHRYVFGVYWEPPGFNPPPDDTKGSWAVRLFNQRDPRSWWARLTARVRAPVDASVLDELRAVLATRARGGSVAGASEG